MGEYKVTVANSADKEINGLDDNLLNRIFPKIKSLGAEPRPAGCCKVKGKKNLWRIRVSDYRIIYNIYDKERIVDIVGVRHRSIAYR